ncbi:TAXI family TRAP transporter solute-binding subunit [Microbaculum marinisediminis]|uniref:TAXI family TRAP transporter solute-binding subunit n=1 Tax=Microbaculum marinisediminis TaxID=2931392 RepID=A0AAW5R7U0_9HYPH|nr:TAXI family TRAP transporter solute-binding subunit [Microbaculum sp. A6E488]MCT8974641.1 TAXI family TRAP transporter solute-binding subunit [Microbaculum sp. A6E488]
MLRRYLKGTAIAVTLAVAATGASAQTFTVGTTEQGSSGYAMTSAMAKVTLKEAGIRLRAMPQGGPVVTAPLVASGDLDFSIAVSFVAAMGHKGVEMFEPIGPLEDVVVVAALRTLPLGVMVPKDSDVQTPADFKGKTMPSEFNTQRVMKKLLDAVYEIGGFTSEDIEPYPAPTGGRSLEDMVAGKVAGTVYTMDSGAAQQAQAQIGIRYIDLEPTDENIAIVAKNVPGALIGEISPGPAFPGVEEPVHVFVAPFLLLGNKNTDPAAVAAILEALWGNKDELVKSYAGFESFDPQKMYADVGIPYHAAALEFYKSKGLIN